MMAETYMTSVTHDGTCPVCGRKLRGLRDLDWFASGTQRVKCDCSARLTVSVGWVFWVEAEEATHEQHGGNHS